MELCDIHTHLVYGVDDGPPSLDEALKGLRALRDLGFTLVAATPHRRTALFPDMRAEIPRRFEELRAAAGSEGLRVELRLGAEYFFGDDLFEDFGSGGVQRLGAGNKFVLVEFQKFSIQEFHKNFIFKMSLRGLVPVLAHPERADMSSSSARDMFDYLVGNGALVQCDLLSLVGEFGWGTHTTDRVLELVDRGIPAAFSTDLHCTAREIELLPRAIEVLTARVGVERTAALLGDNPRQILAGKRPKGPA
ncbi:MAG: hypothetical protein HY897_01455 [Deltaproteobacteria bacterium]|nr:hypothetical protein [Deltaproteobacteria bacterium]